MFCVFFVPLPPNSQKEMVSTCNPKDIQYDSSGKKTSGEYHAEGDVIFNTKNLAVESVDYTVSDGKLKVKAQTAGSSVSVRTENTRFLSADAEGKASGSFTANAKAVGMKSMDVDKDSLADSALTQGGTMTLVSEKMYVGSKSDKEKSKRVQVVSEEKSRTNSRLPSTKLRPNRRLSQRTSVTVFIYKL